MHKLVGLFTMIVSVFLVLLGHSIPGAEGWIGSVVVAFGWIVFLIGMVLLLVINNDETD